MNPVQPLTNIAAAIPKPSGLTMVMLAMVISALAGGAFLVGAHRINNDAKLLPERTETVPENCRARDSVCPRAVITVYRSDVASFRNALQEVIEHHGGIHRTNHGGELYALLTPRLAEDILELASQPRQNRVTPGYDQWLEQALAFPAAADEPKHGVRIAVGGECSACLDVGSTMMITAAVIAVVYTAIAIIDRWQARREERRSAPAPPN